MFQSLQFSVLTAFLCGALTACTSVPMETRDGPPNHPVNVANIPNASPKPEAPCRYGNQSSYVVRGKTYHVLPSSTGYQKTGLASWYGTKFNGHRTSCGEPYNMLAMTAASKTLPLPTYVKVINLTNNREIIVKVNDRGPFHPNRILDLSYAAAKKLDMIAKGTARVTVTALNAKALSHLPHFSHTQITQGYLQVGAYQNIHYAEAQANTLKQQLYQYPQIHVHTNTRDHLTRVLIGPFSTLKQKQTIKKLLMTLKVDRVLEVLS